MTYRKRYELARSFIAERGLRDQFWAWVISRKKAKSWEEFAEFKHPKKSSAEIIHEYRKAEEKRFLKLAKGDKIKAFRLWLNAGNKDNELYQKAKTSNDIEKFICVDCGAIHWFKPIECHNCGKKKFKKIKQVK